MVDAPVNPYFPYPTPRPGQLALIEAIREDAAGGRHLCVEAANGFGKTIAAIAGVLPLLEKANYGIIYVARTHKQLDRVIQELQLISEPTGVNGVVLRGRASTCLNPLVQRYATNAQIAMFICFQLKRSGRCKYYENLLKKIQKNPKYFKMFYTFPLTGLELRQKCESEHVCPYELTKRLLPFATVVATTYNQIFDSKINPSFFEAFARPLSQTILLLDEAHNLPRIAVDLASAKLSSYSIQQSIKEAKRHGLSSVARFSGVLENVIQSYLSRYIEQEIKLDPDEFTQQITQGPKIPNFESFSKKLLETGKEILKKLLAEEKPPFSYIHSLARFFVQWCHFIQRSDAAFFLTRNDNNRHSVQLEILALDPRSATTPILDNCHASVHMSGTLQPMTAHIDLVGLPSESQTLNIPSPFSSNQICSVISLGVTTAMKYRTKSMFKKINRRIIEASNSTPHNIGVFFPSYNVLNSVLDLGLDSLIEREVFIEKPGLTSSENDKLIQAFKRKADDGAVLLGVLGGRNSEGEDYPGHEMETVVVVGVPYAIPSPREAVRIEYFESQFPNKGRLYGYQLPAMRSASQAAGRSVRRIQDRGAIVFLDDRYATPFCNKLLPKWIIQNLRRLNDAEGILFNELKTFYYQS